MERWGIKGRFKAVRQNTVLPGHGYLIVYLLSIFLMPFMGNCIFFVVVLLNILV